MIEICLPPVEQAQAKLAACGFLVAPALLSPPVICDLQSSLASLPVTHVTCGIPNVSWGEQQIPVGHPVHRLFSRADLQGYIARAVGVKAFRGHPQCWTSHYTPGEYINEHRDVVGTVQLLLCLVAPPANCGGTLLFGEQGRLGSVCLRPGDGLLFFASSVHHATVPLCPTNAVPHPERLVAVARYFAATRA